MDLPPTATSQRAQKEATVRREVQRVAALVARAEEATLIELVGSLQALGGGSAVRAAWNAVAQRCIELSRLGQIQGTASWAKLLDAFALAECLNPAVLAEAEQALLGDAGVCVADRASLIAVVAAMNAASPHTLSVSVLDGASARLKDVGVDAAGIDVPRIAGFAHAFTRGRVCSDHVTDLVLRILHTDLPPEELDHGVVADVALFCHVFALHSLDLGWLVPRAADLVGQSDAATLSRVLPLLASVGAAGDEIAADAFSKALNQHLPALSGVSGLESLSEETTPLLLEALALFPERRDLAVVLRLSAQCLRLAPLLDLRATVSVASSLAILGVRQERLLGELGEQLVVRHQRELGLEEVRAVLHAWTVLRSPHAGLEEVLRRKLHEAPAAPWAAGMLEAFAAVTAPGPRANAAP